MISQLLNSLLLFWVFIGISIFLKLTKNKYCNKLFRLSILWLFIISVSPIPELLIYNLEKQNKTINLTSKINISNVNILVLGSGQTNDTALAYINRLSSSALMRLSEGIRIHNKIPKSKLVFSGFSNVKKISQAKMLSLASLELGVNPLDTLMLVKGSVTKEEALEYNKRFGTKNKLIIVTNAVHMPRALLYFRNFGLDVIPAPTNNFIKIDNEEIHFWFKPSYKKIEMMDRSLHEYAGILQFYCSN